LATSAALAVSTLLSAATAVQSQVTADPQQSPMPRYEVRRATGPIVIDGVMADAAWESASPPAALHALWEQQTGPRHATAARILWDDEFLYVGYDCEDTDITAQLSARDDWVYRDDAVEIFINPLPSQTGLYYGLEMNARAVFMDYLMYDSRHIVRRFDMEGVRVVSHLRGTLNARGDADSGWSLEVAIPWSNFADLAEPPSVGTVWRANLNRWDGVPPDRTMSIWSDPLQENPRPHVPERFGELVFVD